MANSQPTNIGVTVKSMAYDHPAYTSLDQRDLGAIAAGSGSSSAKFCAFTAKILKSVVLRVSAAATSNDTEYVYQISGTSTYTFTLGTMGSAGVPINGTMSWNCAQGTGTLYSNAAGSAVPYGNGTPPVINQGDEYYFAHGTDLTLAISCGAIEEAVQPLANVAAP